jgi:hypothetical protein
MKRLTMCAALCAVMTAGCYSAKVNSRTQNMALEGYTREDASRTMRASGDLMVAEGEADIRHARADEIRAQSDARRLQARVSFEAGMARVESQELCNELLVRARHMNAYQQFRCQRLEDQSFTLQMLDRGGMWLPAYPMGGLGAYTGLGAAATYGTLQSSGAGYAPSVGTTDLTARKLATDAAARASAAHTAVRSMAELHAEGDSAPATTPTTAPAGK